MRGSPPLRVLHFADVINRRDFIDTVVRHADPASFAMAACTLGVPSNIEDPGYARDGFACWELAAPSRRAYPRVAAQLARLLKKERIDVLHAHHYEPCAVAAAATTLWPRTRLVVGRHYSDAIYQHTTGLHRVAMLWVEALVHRRATRIVVPAQRIRSLLVDRQAVPARKVAVVPYGFETTRFDRVTRHAVERRRRDLGLENRFSVGTFGRLHSEKGQRYLIDSLVGVKAAIPTLKCLIVGEGDERANLERQAAALGLSEVCAFLGWRDEVPELMAAVDVVVQPSEQEAFSQSMAEALFLRRPLIIGDVSCAPELVPDGTVGVVVPCRDTVALERAIVDLAHDHARRASLGDAARQHAHRVLTIETTVREMEAVYRACARG